MYGIAATKEKPIVELKHTPIKHMTIEEKLRTVSGSYDDLILVLWKCLGIGEPLEIIDDEDTKHKKISVAML